MVACCSKTICPQQKSLQQITIGHRGKCSRQLLKGYLQETYFFSATWEPMGAAEMTLYAKIV